MSFIQPIHCPVFTAVIRQRNCCYVCML